MNTATTCVRSPNKLARVIKAPAADARRLRGESTVIAAMERAFAKTKQLIRQFKQ